MPAGNPLVEDMPGQAPSLFGAQASANAGPLSGGAQVGYEHPTHFWVAGLILLALAGIVVLHITGFRFATDVGVTRG